MTTAELAIVIRAQDRAGTPLRKLKTQLTGLNKTVDGMGKSFKSLTSLLGVAGGASIGGLAVTTGYAFNSMQENAELAFKTILKDGDKAKKMVADIQDVAKVTPFDTESLTRATQRLLAFGFKADDVLPTLMDISDAVSGLGGGTEMIDRVTNAFGQMQAKGKASTEELMQLAEAGIPVWSILKDNVDELFGAEKGQQFRQRMQQMTDSLVAQGKSLDEATKLANDAGTQSLMKMVQGGKLSSDKAIAALRKGLSQRFGGLSKEQSKTVSGAASTFKDTLAQLLGDLTKGPFKETAGALLSIADALDRLRDNFKDLPEPIKTVVSWIASIGSVVAGLLTGGAIAGLIGALGEGGLIGILGRLAGVVTGATGPGLVLAAAFEIAKLGWERNLKPVFDAIDAYLKTFPNVKVGLTWANDQAETVARWLMSLAASVSTSVKVAVQWANDAARDLATWANQAAKNVKQTVQVAVEWANEAARTLANWVQSVATSVAQTVKVAWQWLDSTSYQLANWVVEQVGVVAQTVKTAWEWASQGAYQLANWVNDRLGEVVQTVATGWVWLSQGAYQLANWVNDRLGEVYQTVATGWVWLSQGAYQMANWVNDRLGEVYQTVKTGWEWASGAASQMANWVAAHVGTLSTTIRLDLQWVSDSVKKIYEWLTGVGATIVRGGALPVVNVGGSGHVPTMAAGGLVTSPTLAMIGEAGPEAVVPLSRAGALGGQTIVVQLNAPVYGFANFEDAVRRAIDRADARGRF